MRNVDRHDGFFFCGARDDTKGRSERGSYKTMRNNLLLIITLLFAACAVRRPAAQEPQAAAAELPAGYTAEQAASFHYFEGIRAAAIHNELTSAAANFMAAVQYDSLHAPSWFELSNLYFPVDPDRALEYGGKAATLDPENPWFRQQLGRLYVMSGHYAEARTIYDEIVRAAPNNLENYRFLAALYEETGAPYAALAVLDSAEVRFGFIEELASYKRQLLIRGGMIERAIEEAQELTFNSPYDAENFVILGDLLARTGKDSLALDAYGQALALQPQNADALLSLTDFYRVRGDGAALLTTARRWFELDEVPLERKIAFFDEVVRNPAFYRQYYFAVSDLASALAVKYPAQPEAMELYARHLINSGRLSEALEVYKSALTEASDVKLYQTIIEIEAYQKHDDSAAYYTALALDRFPGNMDLYFTQSAARSYAGDYKGAIRSMRQAARYASTDSVRSVLRSAIGDIVHQSDSVHGRRRSFPHYEKALKYNPDNILALNNYAYFLCLEGEKLERALAMSARVLELEPGNATYIDTYGWILFRLGRLEEAKTALLQAVALDRDGNPELFIHYGDVLHALGDDFMASVYWRKAREAGYDHPAEIEKRLEGVQQR